MSAKPLNTKVTNTQPEYDFTDTVIITAEAVADLYCDRCGWPLRWGTRVYQTVHGRYCSKGCATADLAQGVLQ